MEFPNEQKIYSKLEKNLSLCNRKKMFSYKKLFKKKRFCI